MTLTPYPVDIRVGADPALSAYCNGERVWVRRQQRAADFTAAGVFTTPALQQFTRPAVLTTTGQLSATVTEAVAATFSVTDDFNRPNSTTSAGMRWTNRNDTVGISSNAAYGVGGWSLTSYNTPAATDDMEVSVIFGSTVGGENQFIGLGYNAAGQGAFVYNNGTGYIIFYQYAWAANSWTTQASFTGPAMATGNKLTFRRVGNVYTALRNDVVMVTWTDSTNMLPRDSSHRLTMMGLFGGARKMDSFTLTPVTWTPLCIPDMTVWLDAEQTSAYVAGPQQRTLAPTATPVNTAAGDYNLGLRFIPTVNGRITHIRGYTAAGTHTHGLWQCFTPTTGTKLASVTDTHSGPTGYREIALPTPVDVVAGAEYAATVSSNGGFYCYSPLPASLTSNITTPQGCYGVGPDVFPLNGVGGSTYHVDVVFQQPPLWTDMSDHGNNGTAGVGTAPVIMPATLNGKPVMRTTQGQGTIRGSGMCVNGSYDLTVFIVGRAWGANKGRIFGNVYPPYNFLIGTHAAGEPCAYDGAGWVGPAPSGFSSTPSPWRIYTLAASDTPRDSTLYYDGTLHGSSAASLGHGTQWTVSGDYAGTETGDGEVAEVLTFNRRLTDPERAQIENYLRTKWGL